MRTDTGFNARTGDSPQNPDQHAVEDRVLIYLVDQRARTC
jgi:hypothetical protein